MLRVSTTARRLECTADCSSSVGHWWDFRPLTLADRPHWQSPRVTARRHLRLRLDRVDIEVDANLWIQLEVLRSQTRFFRHLSQANLKRSRCQLKTRPISDPATGT